MSLVRFLEKPQKPPGKVVFLFYSMLGEIPQKEEKIVIYLLFKTVLNKLLLFHFYILKINTLAPKLN
ncbi:hypothetical protein CMT47_17510 [Elizabethkingia anophelis]|nr:hypothetical protein [Elizabethkingia anophelis]MDV3632079.1 hypothetical protein [Elizabethkingia anophelis]MDV3874110.1 hypothetical protein [Elizabethkingia anophelis]MDV3938913.1 hypothetical protein [Elizabethkingia anophelis]MDV4087929.1 hypothetical protein [Elizabethkingia anophelis]